LTARTVGENENEIVTAMTRGNDSIVFIAGASQKCRESVEIEDAQSRPAAREAVGKE
jgi:hypothetical protein